MTEADKLNAARKAADRVDDDADKARRQRIAKLHDELFGRPPVGTPAHTIFYGGDND